MLEVERKIKTIDELAQISEQNRSEGKTVVLCHGEFDLLHIGHQKYFIAAKKEGDILIVTLTPDAYINKGPGRPVFNEQLRAEAIAALEFVDYVGINKWPTAIETIKAIKPNIYAKGSEYLKQEDVTGRIYKEEELVKSLGGDMVFIEDITFSSSTLLKNFFKVYPEEALIFLKKFGSKYSSDDIIEKIKRFKDLKVLVIGETIIDEYYYCEPKGKSPKSNIITTKYVGEERFAGGVLATANHVAEFCDNVTLVSYLGTENSYDNFIHNHLNKKIKHKFFTLEGAHTIVKRRFVEPGFLSKMFEIAYLDDRELPDSFEDKVCEYLEDELSGYDVVIVNDYGHGFINKVIINALCSKSKFLAVNTQTNSTNTGFNLVTKFPRADYICIDEPEVRLACHDRHSSEEKLIKKISTILNCKKTTITLGKRGAMTFAPDEGITYVPVLSTSVVDTVGAGDAFLALSSLAVVSGFSMEEVGFLGNAVGAMAVQIVCNREPIQFMPLSKFIIALLK